MPPSIENLTFEQGKQNLINAGFSFDPSRLNRSTPDRPIEVGDTTPDIPVGEVNRDGLDFGAMDTSDLQSQIQSIIGSIGTGFEQQDQAIQEQESTLLELLGQSGLQDVEQVQLQQEAGIPDFKREQRDVLNQIQQARAGLSQQLADESGRPVSAQFKTGRQGEMVRQASARIEGLTAVNNALQGNIDSANESINQQLTLKYGVLQNNINSLSRVIEVNKDRLSKKEQRLAERRQAELSFLNTQLESRKEDEQMAKQIVLQQIQNGSMPSSVASEILSGDITTDRLLSDYGAYLTDPVARVNLALKNIELQEKQAEMELLKNPPEDGLTPALKTRLEKLSDGERNTLISASKTSEQIDELISIIQSTDDLDRLTSFSEEGRKFKRIAEDVADKMARERTGAVVSSDEQASFKRILGLSFGSQILSDDQELVDNLNSYKQIHDNSAKLIDPDSSIRNFLGESSTTVVGTEDKYLDEVLNAIPDLQENPYANYLNE